MPYYEYQCRAGHVTEKFFKSISEGEKVHYIVCDKCQSDPELRQDDYLAFAKRVPSVPMPAHLYGDPAGYAKPSPTKRHSTKLVSKLEGNKHSAG